MSAARKNAGGAKLVERMPSKIKYVAIIAVLVLASFGIAYALGVSDNGQINVGATILNNDSVEGGSGPDGKNINTHSNLPNGGLVPADPDSASSQPEPAVEGESTTADETATSTGESTENDEDASSLQELSASLAEEEESSSDE